jgi:hypothetical protein
MALGFDMAGEGMNSVGSFTFWSPPVVEWKWIRSGWLRGRLRLDFPVAYRFITQ